MQDEADTSNEIAAATTTAADAADGGAARAARKTSGVVMTAYDRTSRLVLVSPLLVTVAGLVMGFLGVAVSPWLFSGIFLAGVVLIIALFVIDFVSERTRRR